MAKQTVDLELKKALLELQVQMLATSKKINEIDADLTEQHRLLDEIRLNSRSLPYSISANTYDAVGRIFRLSDIENLKEYHERKIEINSHIEDQVCTKMYLQRSLKKSESDLRELIRQKRAKYVSRRNKKYYYLNA